MSQPAKNPQFIGLNRTSVSGAVSGFRYRISAGLPLYDVPAGDLDHCIGTAVQPYDGDVEATETEASQPQATETEASQPQATETEASQPQATAPAAGTPLPQGFPYYKFLTTHGLTTIESVRNATDDELIAVKGIGASSLKAIHNAL
jgi:hypothetical protein